MSELALRGVPLITIFPMRKIILSLMHISFKRVKIPSADCFIQISFNIPKSSKMP